MLPQTLVAALGTQKHYASVQGYRAHFESKSDTAPEPCHLACKLGCMQDHQLSMLNLFAKPTSDSHIPAGTVRQRARRSPRDRLGCYALGQGFGLFQTRPYSKWLNIASTSSMKQYTSVLSVAECGVVAPDCVSA